MTQKMLKWTVALTLFAGMAVQDTWAWSPKARQSVALMAMQLMRTPYPNVFQPGETAFENAVSEGAKLGYEMLEGREPLATDEDVIQAIGSQIQLLRDARKTTMDDYFALRLGVLAALIADASTPFGFAWTQEDQGLRQRIEADADGALDHFSFRPQQNRLTPIEDIREYFKSRRQFFDSDKAIIADDYRSGKGFNGMLSKSAGTYLSRAVEMTADVWHTILRPEASAYAVPASAKMLKRYYADAIIYWLERKNIPKAEETYASFAGVPSQDAVIYESLGDAYYACATPEMTRHALREWNSAYRLAAANRAAVTEKLVNHYVGEGRRFLDKASKPGAEDQDLLAALDALEAALQLENGSQEIADLIRTTKVKQKEREEKLKLITDLIAQGQQCMELGEQAETNSDDSNAIKHFRQAISMYQAVDDTFAAQSRTAKNSISELDRKIKKVLSKIIERATTALEDGDARVGQKKFDEAITSYAAIEQILSVLPDDAPQEVLGQRTELLTQMKQKSEQAKNQKLEYERAMKAQMEAQKNRKPGAPAPAAGASAAGSTAPAPAAETGGGRGRRSRD